MPETLLDSNLLLLQVPPATFCLFGRGIQGFLAVPDRLLQHIPLLREGVQW